MNCPRLLPPLPASIKRSAAIAALLALHGCGGGGDSNTAAMPVVASASSPSGSPASTCGLADFQAAALARVNQYRASGASCRTEGSYPAATALTWNAQLTQAAQVHSQDMQANNFFSHTGSNGSAFDQRVDATGYRWSALAENIAAGQATINAVVDGWMGSDGHCKNIMNPNLVEVGLACASGTSGNAYSTYWSMELGRPR